MLHRVDIEQEVDLIDDRSDLARSMKLDAAARTFERIPRPNAVEILIHIP
jgi:flagellar motility protein MotE (MotC chaperone)